MTQSRAPRDVPSVRGTFARMSDGDLLRSREADAFAILYDRHVASVYRWARTRVGDHAADVTAEVFARAWLRRGTFRDHASGNAAPWLYGIAHNVLLDSLRNARPTPRPGSASGCPKPWRLIRSSR